MSALRFRMAALALFLGACATAALPPAVRVTDLTTLAGTYSGTMKEAREYDRSARLVIQPDGNFELTASDPKGLRTLGEIKLQPDGTLRYGYKELRGSDVVLKGNCAVHEGDGQRVIVLSTPDGSVITTVRRSLP